MDYNRLPSGLIKCTVTAGELRERGIDPTNFLDDPELVGELYDEILEHTVAVFGSPSSLPFILEAVPTYDLLTLIISLGEDVPERPENKENKQVKADSPEPDGVTATPVLLPIDELQASVISDLISAAENGNIVEHLKKYLNEDFLDSLIHALSESGLESLISSFFSPPGADIKESAVTKSMADEAKEKEMTERLEGYIEQINAMKDAPTSSEKKKKHRRICVMAEFKSLDDVEHAVGISNPDGFTGESYLFKTDDRTYLLVLSSGDMPVEEFRRNTASVMNFFGGRETPEASLFSLLEHETPLIEKNAVEALLGKI